MDTNREANTLGRHWPALLAIAVTWLTAALLWQESLRQCDGTLVYALDDAYIHMAVARNFVQEGVWGVTRGEFSSSSSSPLWTLALAGIYAVLGPSEAAPLVMNLLLAAAIIVALNLMLAPWLQSGSARSGVLLAIVLTTPVHAVMFGGMEHLLHTLLTLLLAYIAARELSVAPPARPGAAGLLLLVTALATVSRYEALFLVALVCVLFGTRRAWPSALAVGLGGVAPHVIYGALAVRQGWQWLPNSILLKGNVPDASVGGVVRLALSAFSSLSAQPVLFVLVTVALVLFIRRCDHRQGIWDQRTLMLGIFVADALLHLQFASVGWFYRYEAYLVALGGFVIAAALADEQLSWSGGMHGGGHVVARRVAVALVLLVVACPLARRAVASVIHVPGAMWDRYLEHVQLARFVAAYYDRDTVMINDIGAVAYYSNARILDMYGLSSLEPLDFRKQPSGYTADDVFKWARAQGARIAILQIQWAEIKPRIPRQWVKVAEWETPRNIVHVDTRVGFFATEESEAPRLAAHLREFAARRPADIKQTVFP